MHITFLAWGLAASFHSYGGEIGITKVFFLSHLKMHDIDLVSS